MRPMTNPPSPEFLKALATYRDDPAAMAKYRSRDAEKQLAADAHQQYGAEREDGLLQEPVETKSPEEAEKIESDIRNEIAEGGVIDYGWGDVTCPFCGDKAKFLFIRQDGEHGYELAFLTGVARCRKCGRSYFAADNVAQSASGSGAGKKSSKKAWVTGVVAAVGVAAVAYALMGGGGDQAASPSSENPAARVPEKQAAEEKTTAPASEAAETSDARASAGDATPEPKADPTPAEEPPSPALDVDEFASRAAAQETASPTDDPAPEETAPTEPAPTASAPAAPASEILPAASGKASSSRSLGKPGAGHGPEKYPEAYASFLKSLDEQVKRNTMDFCPAVQAVLKATGDEFAVDQWMRKAADKGNVAAMFYLADAAVAYVPEDKLQSAEMKKNYEYVRKAAEKGFSPAQCVQSTMLQYGIGVKKNPAAARKVLTDACKTGGFIPRTRWLLLNDRLTTFADKDRPEVKAEIERGNHYVVHYLSRKCPDSVQQLEWLNKAASLGNAEAYYDLACAFLNSDPQKGYAFLLEGAKLHDRSSLMLLGSFLLGGDPDVPNPVIQKLKLKQDVQAGLHLVRTAATLGSAEAVYYMGNVYYRGLYGVSSDKNLAYRHFSRGVELGAPELGAAAGLMLLKGEGVKQDAKQGLRLITMAANARYYYAVVLLAYAHYKGLGVDEANAQTASEYLQEAAALGRSDAYVYLAYIAAHGGPNLPANKRLSESYMRMASYDLKERAQQIYDKLEAAGKWEPEP